MAKHPKHILAKTLSGIFHPLLLPVYLSIILLFASDFTPNIHPRLRWQIIAIVAYTFVCLPVGILYILNRIGKISNIQLNEQRERFLPMLLITISYIIGLHLLHRLNAPGILIILMRGAGLAIIVVALISLLWKISAHMTAIGGALGTIIVLSIIYKTDLSSTAILISLVAGTIGWSRLYLNHHTIKQVNFGFLLGAGIMIISFFLHALL